MKNSQLYQQVKDQELLKGVSLAVFEIICRKPGLTVGQLEREYGNLVDEFRPRNELAKRVSDLAAWGAIRSSGRTTCPVTGRKAKTWEVTGELPNKDHHAEKKNLPQPLQLSEGTFNTLKWLANICDWVSRKWYLPWVWQAKALDARNAVLDVLQQDLSNQTKKLNH